MPRRVGLLLRALCAHLRGWMQSITGRSTAPSCIGPCKHINAYLMRWIRKKYKRLHTHQKAKAYWLRIPSQNPKLFAHRAWVSQSWWSG